jgi:EmrB/QacA subfamily drug resistance transporter
VKGFTAGRPEENAADQRHIGETTPHPSRASHGPLPSPTRGEGDFPVPATTQQASVGWVLFGLCLVVLLSQLGGTIVNVGLPTLMDAFQAGFGAVQWVVLSYLLAVTAIIVSVGRLGDLVGKKPLFLFGLVVFTLASAGCGAAPSLAVLIAARIVQGLGAAILMALTFAFVGDVVPKARAGYAMGVLGTMSSFTTTLAPSLGGLLISSLGWRWLFFLNVPLGVIAYLVVRRHLPGPAIVATETRRQRFDWAGTLALVTVLVAYSLAMTRSQASGFGDRVAVDLLIAAAVGLVVFVIVQARVAAPLVDLAMFRDVRLSAGSVMSLLVAAIMMATLILAPFFLSRAVGLSTRDTGLVMAVGPLSATLVGIPAGRVADRIGAVWTMIAGLVCLTLGVFWMSLISPDQGAAGYAMRVAVISVGYGFFQTPNNVAVMEGARADQRGVVSSLLNLARTLGFITGASLMGAIFAMAVHAPGQIAVDVASASPEAIAKGMHVTFAVATGMGLAALLLAGLTLLVSPRLKPARSSGTASAPDSSPLLPQTERADG